MTGESVLLVEWHDHDVRAKGVRERRFDVVHEGRRVPAVLWQPEQAGAGPVPLVLAGHGLTHSKTAPYLVALGRVLVRRHGIAAVAIDGPGHGERRAEGPLDDALLAAEFAQRWSEGPRLVDDTIADWQAVAAAVQAPGELGPGPLGYWGLSMGTIFGVSLVAAEPRIAAAVLGLWGLSGPGRDRLAADAAAIGCPVLFLVQWGDELCPRQRQFELFGAIASADKRLHANPGAHSAVPPEQFMASADFLARHLGGPGADGSAPR
jgi:dienelactone hydrolase